MWYLMPKPAIPPPRPEGVNGSDHSAIVPEYIAVADTTNWEIYRDPLLHFQLQIPRGVRVDLAYGRLHEPLHYEFVCTEQCPVLGGLASFLLVEPYSGTFRDYIAAYKAANELTESPQQDVTLTTGISGIHLDEGDTYIIDGHDSAFVFYDLSRRIPDLILEAIVDRLVLPPTDAVRD